MDLTNILFLDIETVAGAPAYSNLSDRMRHLWDKKAALLNNKDKEELSSIELYERAGIYAEFGKIVTIGVGYFHKEGDKLQLRVKDISSHNEIEILAQFKKLLEESFSQKQIRLCAHNGREFDFPYIARRMIINGVKLPDCLNMAGKKPWEITHIDTMDFWKFGDYKNFTSLDLLAAVLEVPTSKDDIDGSQVNEVYYKDNDLERIGEYCKKDVSVLAQVFLKLIQEEPIAAQNIVIL
jgi:uncharacterized protein YprB with RNaseH-like and TPR domain